MMFIVFWAGLLTAHKINEDVALLGSIPWAAACVLFDIAVFPGGLP